MMPKKIALTAAFALSVLTSGAAAYAGTSLSEYRQQLAELKQRLDTLGDNPEQAAATEAALPVTVVISTNSGEITVNYQHLKDDLASFSRADAQKRPGLLKQIQSYVQALEREAAAFDQTETDQAGVSDNIKQILARREFHKVRGPSAKDILLAKVYNWLTRLLNKIRGPGKGTYNVIQVLVWIFVGGAVLALIVWTARRLMGPEAGPSAREIVPFAPSARSWRSWLAEARESAARQDWRNAIHLAYWAGISFLESGGAWKPNRARTPREYLRLLSSRNPRHPALTALTRKFEIVWYGHRSAAEEDFREALGRLEELGCR
jgi:uncharacterized protein DUF4129